MGCCTEVLPGTGVSNEVPGERVGVFVGRMNEEDVFVGEGVPVVVGESGGLTGSRTISAM